MSETPIEWTDFSINPIRARYAPTDGDGHYCEKVGTECKHCYASRSQPRFGMPFFETQRRLDVEHYFDDAKLQQVLRRRKPTKWFWCDMTDMFGAWVPDAWIDRCFAVMALTPQHTHQVLTKRADRMRAYFASSNCPHPGAARNDDVALAAFTLIQGDDRFSDEDALLNGDRWPLPNVWAGVSVGVRPSKSRLDDLRATPAAVRFASFEPLLEDLGDLDLAGIDWAILGGESGQRARPCDVAWLRSIQRQCGAAGVSIFVKQLGANIRCGERHFPFPPPARYLHTEEPLYGVKLRDKKGGNPTEWPEDLRVRQFPHKGRPR